MLSVFPSLFSWSEVSPLLIRLTLGIIFILWSHRILLKFSRTPVPTKAVALLEFISGVLLVIGLWTQVAALYLIADLVIRLYFKIKSKSFLTDGVNYYFILLVLALSLLVTGAGLLAFDIRL